MEYQRTCIIWYINNDARVFPMISILSDVNSNYIASKKRKER